MLVVSACLEDEAAIASTSQTNGLSAFTSCLLASIRRLGPNRSTVEALQAAGHELRRLGFRQTPIVKEPVEPEHLGLRAFLTFQPALFVYSPTTPGAEHEEQISRSVAEAIRNSLSSLKEGRMQGTMSGQTFMGEDIGAITNAVSPIVASLLQQQRGYQSYGQPYGGFGQNFQQFPFQNVPQNFPQNFPWTGFGGGQHFGHHMGAQPFGLPQWGQSGGHQWGLSPYSSFGLSQFGGGYGHQQAQELSAIVTSVVCNLLPVFQSRGYAGFGLQGYQQPWGAGAQPHEIAQIVSAVTPIVASIVQSRGQMMPRAA